MEDALTLLRLKRRQRPIYEAGFHASGEENQSVGPLLETVKS